MYNIKTILDIKCIAENVERGKVCKWLVPICFDKVNLLCPNYGLIKCLNVKLVDWLKS